MTEVTLDGLTKVYSDSQGTETAVEDVSLTIEDGEFVVIVGPSGCGKSTTLRMIAGLETVTDGVIEFGGEEVQHLTPSTRDVAMVFQNYALYPSMNARKNIEYGLKHSTDLSKSERQERVAETAEMLDIEEVLEHSPEELSGGQKQRVALGRAIVREPNVFLLDEPLSNLDAKLRSSMRHEIQRIHDEIGVTSIYVTHDQKEAMTMADRIVLLKDGKMQQIATPERLYNEPNNLFTAQFVGSPSMNLLDVSLESDGEDVVVRHEGSQICTLPATGGLPDGDTVTAGLRPEHIEISEEPGDETVPAEVVVPEYQGKTNFIHVELLGQMITVRTEPDVLPEKDSTVHLSIDSANLYLFDTQTGETLKHRETTGRESVRASQQS
ncbi:ABC transporter ATP-binding protein [Natrarchaeobius chitinivorans]|uniref:ABC-type D-xylose/L-arabinose transporter n=1 Tax=Natrarchaeobius chitinivorans TaxID=1679083 RepID=A0A3N6M4E1_NATCH|nr:sn-glycerol-3-phosphate ABC transporter ATP-binding protein UgpC [Natrarchaeobius chitinivorans]RQG95354.1 sn-glycerol-3-phosphate ABC transporter ATP-binding protein UgpC [Natrarchaeobius chitinivorans]